MRPKKRELNELPYTEIVKFRTTIDSPLHGIFILACNYLSLLERKTFAQMAQTGF